MTATRACILALPRVAQTSFVDVCGNPLPPFPPGGDDGGEGDGNAGGNPPTDTPSGTRVYPSSSGVFDWSGIGGPLRSLECGLCRARCSAIYGPMYVACGAGYIAIAGAGLVAGELIGLATEAGGLAVEAAAEGVNHHTFGGCLDKVTAALEACRTECEHTACHPDFPTGP